MFGIVVPGRLVQQAIQVESSERFVATIENSQSLNHLCIFLTSPFPEGIACTIHLLLPGGKGWQLIGGLANAKPSAIFKLRGTFTESIQSHGFSSDSTSNTATLGILCESLAQVEAQLATLIPSTVNPSTSTELVLARPSPLDPILLCQKVASHCFSYVTGFALAGPDGKSYVDVGVVEKWFSTITSKLVNGGIGFLDRD